MKKNMAHQLWLMVSLAVFLLLTACQVNFITNLEDDGSGVYIQEIGFTADEAANTGMNTNDADFCANQNDSLPPGTTTRKETREEDDVWCVYETSFSSLEDLQSIYALSDTRINQLSLEENTLTYDITPDLSGDDSMTMGMNLYWKVTMPGRIIEHNAAEKDGNTLTWNLVVGEENNIRAVSEIGGLGFDFNFDLDGNQPILTIIIGLGGVVLCCILPIVIIVVVILLIRRKKKAAAGA